MPIERVVTHEGTKTVSFSEDGNPTGSQMPNDPKIRDRSFRIGAAHQRSRNQQACYHPISASATGTLWHRFFRGLSGIVVPIGIIGGAIYAVMQATEGADFHDNPIGRVLFVLAFLFIGGGIGYIITRFAIIVVALVSRPFFWLASKF